MTRFERAYYGLLSDWAKKDAREEVEKVRAEYEAGEITIDENGAAFNCIGRPLDSEMAEKLSFVTDEINMEATAFEYDMYCQRTIAAYAQRSYEPDPEQMFEMRAAFGAGTTVVDVLSGRRIRV